MDITGKIILVGEPRTGVSKTTGTPWKTQEYVLETLDDQYPRKFVFSVFGEERIALYNISLGEVVKVFFDFNGREYNGRWYNDIRVWKVERPQPNQSATAPAPAPATTPAPAAAPAPVATPPEDSSSDLPF